MISSFLATTSLRSQSAATNLCTVRNEEGTANAHYLPTTKEFSVASSEPKECCSRQFHCVRLLRRIDLHVHALEERGGSGSPDLARVKRVHC